MGLEHFDTVLSFALVMLLLSLLITILVQVVVAVFGLRGNSLEWGLERLFQQLSSELKLTNSAGKLARKVLTHPMLAHTGGRKATAIRREELLRVLDDLSKTKEAEGVKQLVTGAGEHLKAEVSAWFDTIMDRTTERFVLHTRWLTAAFAVILAVGLHIDSLGILRQLSTSTELRTRLVQSVDTTLDKVGAVMTEAQKPQPEDAAAARVKELGVSLERVAASVDQTGLHIIPRPIPPYVKDWNFNRRHILGTFMSALFLSLGAPFWFNLLRQTANLRPILAGKVEKGKAELKEEGTS
jgi:hypothetical protein